MINRAKGAASRAIFYAWQSDSDETLNRYFIRDAVKKAIEKVNKEDPGAPPLIYDEATLRTPGSPLIIQSILAKIDTCDVFIGDVSIINPSEPAIARVPNPN